MKRRGRALRRRYGHSSRSLDGFTSFGSWPEVLAYAATREPLYYWAPMDHRPVRMVSSTPGGGSPIVVPAYEPRKRSIRIWPSGSLGRGRMRTADPFTAGAGHLDRFYRKVL